MTTAVTEDAPAASALPNFLPTDKHYRMTGEMPAETVEAPAASEEIEAKEAQPLESEGSAPSESETAAASEAAPPQEKPQQKTAASSESRWAKVTRENRELRDRLARLEGAQSARETQRETVQAPPPAKADAEPQISDKDDKGEFKYKTLAEFNAAARAYDRKQILSEVEKTTAKAAQERELAQAEERIQQEINKRTEQARKDHPDYDTVIAEVLGRKTPAGQDFIYFPKGSAVDMFFAESPKSQDIFYEIGKNPDKYGEIFAHDAQGKFLMHPVRQLRLLAQIEGKLEVPKPETPAKPITQAPRPAHQVSGKGTVAKDAIAQAIKDGDSDAYRQEANARELARRKQGK